MLTKFMQGKLRVLVTTEVQRERWVWVVCGGEENVQPYACLQHPQPTHSLPPPYQRQVAARGIDVPSLTHVVNLDVPSSLEQYVHRAGRAGESSLSHASSLSLSLLVVIDRYRCVDIDRYGCGHALPHHHPTHQPPKPLPNP